MQSLSVSLSLVGNLGGVTRVRQIWVALPGYGKFGWRYPGKAQQPQEQHCINIAALYQHCSTVSTLQHCINNAALYQHCSTISTLQHCINTAALYQHCSTVSTLQHCINIAALYQHCSTVSTLQGYINIAISVCSIFLCPNNGVAANVWDFKSVHRCKQLHTVAVGMML